MVYEQTIISKNQFKRTFSQTANHEELLWHRDAKNRLVEVIQGGDWKFQMEDELPITLVAGMELYIPKEVFHRVINGSDQLIVLITEESDE
jgi:quercetin dioxygenase-like cupin family protein